MKKTVYIILALITVLLCSCKDAGNSQKDALSENVVKPDFVKEELDKKFGTDEIYIVKTYMETPIEDIENYLNENKTVITVKHHQLSDGSWMTDEHSYKYMLKITGRLNNAVKDSTYLILSNRDDITFDEAWKASGLSSNAEDYFIPEEAIIVGGC